MIWIVLGHLAAGASGASPLVMESLRPESVVVRGEMGRRIGLTVTNNLLTIDIERDFLQPFVVKSADSGYVGLGKTLDAMVRLAVHTKNESLMARKRTTVAMLLATQEPDGYLGIMKPEARVGALWDVHEMSYLVLGLTSDYLYCGEAPSLEAARRLADYLLTHLMVEPRPRLGDLSPHMPDTGFEQSMLALYAATGEARYREAALAYRPLTSWRPPLTLGRWGGIEGHAYAYLDKCLAQLRLASSDDKGLLAPSRDVMAFLLAGDGLVVTGTCGDHECWHNTQSGTTNLGETCTTAYLLRFWDELYRRTGQAVYGDLMERAIYNALFAAQSPDGRKIRYYTPFEAPRSYFEQDTYCCPGNYRRAIADLPQLVYYRTREGVAVNLYTSSEATLSLSDRVNLKLTQSTDYPTSGDVELQVEPTSPTSFTLSFRVPKWASSFEAKVNGVSTECSRTRGGLRSIQREWRPGDKVTLKFPMEWRLVKGRRTQEGRAAVMRGPVLFTFAPSRNEALKGQEPRLLTLDPSGLSELKADAATREGGWSCEASVWPAGAWYPSAPTVRMTLTEFVDPEGTWCYFHVPNPKDERLVDDELRLSESDIVVK